MQGECQRDLPTQTSWVNPSQSVAQQQLKIFSNSFWQVGRLVPKSNFVAPQIVSEMGLSRADFRKHRFYAGFCHVMRLERGVLCV